MNQLSQKELDITANKILEDYDSKNPGIIFKEKIKINNEDALTIQSKVAKLREIRGEQIVGYKIGCVSKDTQKKMGFTQPACGYLWKSELYNSGVILNIWDPFLTKETQKELNKKNIQSDIKCPQNVQLAFICVNHKQILKFLQTYGGLIYDFKKLNSIL